MKKLHIFVTASRAGTLLGNRTNRAIRMPRWSRYDAEATKLTSKQNPIMSKNNYLQVFAARFAAATTQNLVEEFNRQVGNTGWTSARALHDQALIAELQCRGIDISSVNDVSSTDFNHHVRIDRTKNHLIIID